MRESALERIEEQVVAVARGDALDQPFALVREASTSAAAVRAAVAPAPFPASRSARAGRRRSGRGCARPAASTAPSCRPPSAARFAAFAGAGRTQAVISFTRTNSSTRPANTKQSPAPAARRSSPRRGRGAAVAQAHGDAGLRDDGADRRAMTPRDPGVGYPGDAFGVEHHAPVLGVGVEAGAAVDDEVVRPLPGGVVESGVGMRRADLGKQFGGAIAAAQRAGDQMLDQHVQRTCQAACRGSIARSAAASRAAAASTSSSACVGTMVMRETAPG